MSPNARPIIGKDLPSYIILTLPLISSAHMHKLNTYCGLSKAKVFTVHTADWKLLMQRNKNRGIRTQTSYHSQKINGRTCGSLKREKKLCIKTNTFESATKFTKNVGKIELNRQSKNRIQRGCMREVSVLCCGRHRRQWCYSTDESWTLSEMSPHQQSCITHSGTNNAARTYAHPRDTRWNDLTWK